MRRLFAVVVALAMSAFALPVAASPQPQVSVRPGYDGMVRPGSWAPVDVAVSNAGPALSGNVEISVLRRPATQSGGLLNTPSIDYAVPVSIPQHSSKRFSTAVYVPPFFDHLQVRLVANGKTLYQNSFPLQRVDPSQLFCGALSTDQSAFDSLNGLTLPDGQRQPHVVQLDLPDLPTNPQVLSSLDCLIISDYPTRGLSPVQRSALSAWVYGGGVLTVGTGPNGAGTVDGLPADLLPARLTGTAASHSLQSLADYVGVPAPSAGPWLVGNLKVTDGVVVAADESQPLVVVGRRGKGAVFMLALSLAQRPLRGWSGTDRLWLRILSYVRPPQAAYVSYFGSQAGWGRMPREVLIRGGSLSGTDSRRLLIGLLLFTVVVGPLNLLVFSRLGRRELTLLTTPLLAVLATAGALVYASHHRQGDVVVNQVSIVQTWDGAGVGPVHSFVGVFALHPQRYRLAVPSNSLVADATQWYAPRGQFGRLSPAAQILETGEPQLQGIDLQPGDLSSFSIDGHVNLPGRIDSTVTLRGNRLGGRVVNGLPSTVRSAALIAGGSVEPLGDLRPGASHAVSLSLGNGSAVGYQDTTQVVDRLFPGRARTPEAFLDPQYAILTAALNPYQSFGGRVQLSPISLIGWIDDPIEPVKDPDTGEGAHQYTLFVTSLPLRLSSSSQVIPTQLVDRELLTASYSASTDTSGIVVNAGDTVSYQFTAPVDPAHFALRSLTFATAASSPVLGTLQLYDWRAAAWEDVPYALGNLSIPNPERFFSATGVVRLKFQNRSVANNGADSIRFTRFQLLIGGVGR